LGSKNTFKLQAIGKASFLYQSIASYQIKNPPKSAEFRHKSGFESLSNDDAIRCTSGERSE
jgi:hypothetical protein